METTTRNERACHQVLLVLALASILSFGGFRMTTGDVIDDLGLHARELVFPSSGSSETAIFLSFTTGNNSDSMSLEDGQERWYKIELDLQHDNFSLGIMSHESIANVSVEIFGPDSDSEPAGTVVRGNVSAHGYIVANATPGTYYFRVAASGNPAPVPCMLAVMQY